MDAVKFIEERNRMCNFHYHAGECCECPAKDVECNSLLDMGDDYRIVSVIEKWAAEHPRKTRQSVFLEQWPNAKVDEQGNLCICPVYADKTSKINYSCICSTNCAQCRCDFWGQEVD